ncbi:MAG: DUF3322 domain-containing protein [Pirellulales bacterium]
MKSPAELKAKLRRQWENRSVREARLLGAEDAWPVALSIGRPSATLLNSDLDAVKRHVDSWMRLKVGDVVWESIQYRAVHETVRIPTLWKLNRPSEWVEACGDPVMRYEFESLATLVECTDPVFHSLFVRRRSLWRNRALDEIVLAARVAMALTPGVAAGRPLRALSIVGIDTKFFERNAGLVTALLDVRFDDEVGEIGLHAFLGAMMEGDHWLLVIDLDGTLLPFRQQRVRSSELGARMPPGNRLLIVENEKCQYLLPTVPDTIAVLGAGFNLGWTQAEWLSAKHVAYWGDIDTWGLLYLAKVRTNIGHVKALMMTSEIFDMHAHATVHERVIADETPPIGLTETEESLHKRLLSETNGRLEQEFIPVQVVQSAITGWLQ